MHLTQFLLYAMSITSNKRDSSQLQSGSVFSSVPLLPPNIILGVALECKNDPEPNKIDLTIGAYRSNDGKPYVLPVVRKAESIIASQNLDHEYLTQDGHPVFTKESQKLLLGSESLPIRENRVYSIQGISGTGSLRLAMSFLGKLLPNRSFLIPSVTWPNHPAILNDLKVPFSTYRYLDNTGCSLDIDGFLEDVRNCPDETILLLHSCAHNPSGVDPSKEQWQELLRIVKEKKLLPFFDNAYQGFVSGDPDEDAYSVRLFADAGLELICACSFAKNFGLYGERAGVLHYILANGEHIPAVASQLRAISRAIYSTCPAYGARIVATILSDPQLNAEWKEQCRLMAERLNGVRRGLYESLVAHNVKGTWGHIIAQRGMFSYSGIPASVVAELKAKHHVYMLSDGRISLAGLNTNNIERFVSILRELLGTN